MSVAKSVPCVLMLLMHRQARFSLIVTFTVGLLNSNAANLGLFDGETDVGKLRHQAL